MSAGDSLTEKQRKFAEIYAGNGGNAVAAARDAGYKTPDPEGARLLGNARIVNYIKELSSPERNKRICSAIEIQEFWSSYIKGRWDDDTVKHSDRIKASELLAKSQLMFVEQLKHSGDITVNATKEELDKEIKELSSRIAK